MNGTGDDVKTSVTLLRAVRSNLTALKEKQPA
jgi:hypothetical protein